MLKKINKTVLTLALVVMLASFLRLIHLGSLPSGLNNDEALAGYDAYSLLKTGKDHRGNPWPLYFEGFSDRVSNHFSLYVYSIIPSIAIFDLNEFSTRLPAALYGIITVLITYFLAKEITNNKIIGLLSAFSLAISPWHVQASRFGQEAIMVPLMLSLGALMFIRGIRGQKFLLVLSGLPLALSLYGYSIVKLLAPLVILSLFVIYSKKLWKYKRQALLLIVVLLIVAGPFMYLHLQHFEKLQGRFDQTSIFILNFWFLQFIKEYLACLVPIFFWQAGYIPIYDVILIIIGLTISFFKRKNHNYQLLISLFFIFPLAAALTGSHLHFLKNIFGLSVLPILSGTAVYYIYMFLRRFKLIYQRFFIATLITLVVINFINILTLISKKYIKPIGETPLRHYNFKEAIEYIGEHGNNYEKIYFTNKANQPYIYLLFYLKYDPTKFQEEPAERYYTGDGWQHVKSFDKFIFCDIDKCYNKDDHNLYIAKEKDVPEAKPAEIIYGPDDYSSFKIIDNLQNEK